VLETAASYSHEQGLTLAAGGAGGGLCASAMEREQPLLRSEQASRNRCFRWAPSPRRQDERQSVGSHFYLEEERTLAPVDARAPAETSAFLG